LPDELIFRIHVKNLFEKYFAFSEAQISRMVAPVLSRMRGVTADRHGTLGQDAMDASVSRGERH